MRYRLHSLTSLALALLLGLLLLACGEDADQEPGATGGTSAQGGSAQGGSGAENAGGGGGNSFDPEHPGVNMTLMLGALEMLSQPMELGVAVFMPAAREDFDPPPDDSSIPLDTCVLQAEVTPTPSCTGNEDCAPEQQCLPETDDNGNPIAGTERCVTPREPIDVGPITVEGFTTGSIVLSYNAGQNGAYTPPGSDGTLNPGTLAFDTTYSFHGEGSATYELGPLSGEVYLPPNLVLTSPPLTEVLPSIYGLAINPAVDLDLQWSGANPGGELRLSLASDSGQIACRVTDDGQFTIPAAALQQITLSPIALVNMFTIERSSIGMASGDGLTVHEIQAMQMRLLNVAAQ